MCGIGGIYSYKKKIEGAQSRIRRMSELIEHRGPDDQGEWIQENLAFCHRRLSIIDTSRKGRQPMVHKETGNCIVFNGEFYNFKAFRDRLKKLGYQFHSESDTEVLLYALHEFGYDFIRKIKGFFSFAFWNDKEKHLLLARDPVGIKPLYYQSKKEEVIFSSEIKPILSQNSSSELNDRAIQSYFRYRYNCDSESIFKNIHKLPQGHHVTIYQDGSTDLKRFWEPPQSFDSNIEGSELAKSLSLSVKERLVADVEIGCFLSGGIDSSSILANMKEFDYQTHAYTFQLKGSDDESIEAREFSKKLGFKQSLVGINEDFDEIFRKAVLALEEPIGDSIIYPTYLLCQKASENHKVVLSGEGADEILGGYVHHESIYRLEKIRPYLPKKLTTGILQKLKPLLKINEIFKLYPGQLGDESIERLKGYFSANNNADRMGFLNSLFHPNSENRLLSAEFRDQLMKYKSPYDQFNERADLYENTLLADLQFWSSDYSLLRMDRLGMAHGLEVRYPFFDTDLISQFLFYPKDQRYKKGLRKYQFRKGLESNKYLSNNQIFAKKKPFQIRPDHYFGPKYTKYLKDRINSSAALDLNLIDLSFVNKLINKEKVNLVESKQLFAILIFCIWYDEFKTNRWFRE
jgi:asparagine synthase (glutamine-hydrolysing)